MHENVKYTFKFININMFFFFCNVLELLMSIEWLDSLNCQFDPQILNVTMFDNKLYKLIQFQFS